MSATDAELIAAARVPDSVETGQFGLWTISRARVENLEKFMGPFRSLTMLWHMTPATMMQEHGEVVMEDSWDELARHLPIWRVATGRVLVTGLGLGCVVRGLLANPRVDAVDVIEQDVEILRRIGAEFNGDRRARLIHADAMTWDDPGARWDFGWHDLYVPDGNGYPLQKMHAELMIRFQDRVGQQGAWAFPGELARAFGFLGGDQPESLIV